MALAWHVVHTQANCEDRATQEITGIGYEGCFPTFAKKRIHNHRVEEVLRPLFPRYIFARFDASKPGWGHIKSDCRSVYCILKDNRGNPYVLPDLIMDEIQKRASTPKEAVQADPEYQLHQRLRVKDGIFSGVEGLFIGTEKQRTMALMEIMGKRYKIPVEMIEAA